MRHRRHIFGADPTLDYVVRQAEIIKRYEHLVDYLLTTLPPYQFDQSQTLAAWLEQIEASVVADALQQCNGGQAMAMVLLGESSRRHFGNGARARQANARRSFDEVVHARHSTRPKWPAGKYRRRKAVTP